MSPIAASWVALLFLALPRFFPAIKPPIQLHAVVTGSRQVPLTHSDGDTQMLPAAAEQF
jgi:hypothetical protein